MRSIPALLLFALAAPAAAQPVVNSFAFPEAPTLPLPNVAAQDSVVADTTEPWRYFPLHVGNIWEYRNGMSNPWLPLGTRRAEIIGDTVIDGRAYVTYYERFYAANAEEPATTSLTYLRYDSTRQLVLLHSQYGDEPHPMTPCPLSAFFGVLADDCASGPLWLVGGGYGGRLIFGGYAPGTGSDTVQVVAWKNFSALYEARLAADFGPVYSTVHGGADSGLRYARINGVEYGAPAVIVFSDEDARPAALTFVRLTPNPARDYVHVSYAAPPASAPVLSVYDLLGRRALVLEGLSGGGGAAHVDVSSLAAGAYLLRLCDQAECADVRFARVP